MGEKVATNSRFLDEYEVGAPFPYPETPVMPFRRKCAASNRKGERCGHTVTWFKLYCRQHDVKRARANG